MAKRSLLVALLTLAACGLTAVGAPGKGIDIGARQGVTIPGSPYRYHAISPSPSPRVTVVERIKVRGGLVDRWWSLRGEYHVPAVAYDGIGGGLSADGETLVLSRFTWGYPPKTTRLAILDTSLLPQHPGRHGPGRSRPAFTYVDLPGHFSFDAISPDGSTVYLIHHFRQLARRSSYLANYEVRALDLKSQRLLPEPIVDPSEPEERMEGLPITRAASSDGRWAYTLYDGNGKEPFLHALDTVAGSAVCVDLPQLASLPRRFFYLLQLRMSHRGHALELWRRTPGPASARRLLTVDTHSFEVRKAEPVATASSAVVPWTALGGLLVGGLLVALVVGWRRFGNARPME